MASILEILLTGLIDPIIWMKSMSTLGWKKSKVQSIGGFVICYLLVIGKAFTAIYIDSRVMSAVFTIILAIYVFGTTIFLFEGETREKVLYICIFACVSFAAELIVIGGCLLVRPDGWKMIMCNNIGNLVCTLLSKVLQIVSCYFLFSQKRCIKFFDHNQEIASVLIIIVAMISDLLFMNQKNQQSINATLLFGIIEIPLLWYIISSISESKERDRKISTLSGKVSDDTERAKLTDNIDYFRHEFSTYAFMMKNLWYCREYDQLNQYMDRIFEDVPKIELLFEHPNIVIRILVSGLMQTAKKAGILFRAQIEVDNFGVHDQDICAMIQNVVMNGLEEAVQVSCCKPHVILQIQQEGEGYEIRCTSDSVERRGKKLDKTVDMLIEKCGGTIEQNYVESEEKEYGESCVSIHIPLAK